MFKKQNKPKLLPLDYKRYKTPNHFGGIIFKGFVISSIKEENSSQYINLIRIYKNDTHEFNYIDAEDDLFKIEIMENVVGFTTNTQLPNFLEVYVGITSEGMSCMISIKNKVPFILISTEKEDSKHYGVITPVKSFVKYLKTIPFVDFKDTKLNWIRVTNKEKFSLLNKIKTSLLKKKISSYISTGEWDIGKILVGYFEEHGAEHYRLYNTGGPREEYIVITGEDGYELREVGSGPYKDYPIKNIRMELDKGLNYFKFTIISDKGRKNFTTTFVLKFGKVNNLNNQEVLSLIKNYDMKQMKEASNVQ